LGVSCDPIFFVFFWIGMVLMLADYLLAKEKMHPMLHGHVENHTKLTRKAQLEAYDGCARLRPVWDEIASKYDAVFTPGAVDEAPVGIESTGDAVSPSLPLLFYFRPLIAGPDGVSSRSAACGLFSRFQHSMFRGSQVRMGCQLG
jgi:hypothetical protein